MGTGSNIFFIIGALVAGALIPVQAQTNAAFSKSIGSPYITGLMVFVIGVLCMAAFVAATGTPLPKGSQLSAAPWYGYLGGLIVPAYVISITILVPRLGVGPSIGLIVTGQILCAVAIDHFGLFSATIQRIDLSRTLGVLLMVAGVYLVLGKKA